ncbi:MAG TPA: lamin tail domain-containing protein [Terriglobales bacterium]|nr:lamin tail domain-containing protein [Terriglobales bacterium]
MPRRDAALACLLWVAIAAASLGAPRARGDAAHAAREARAAALCAPAAHPLIAEVFYDAIGDDTGSEFLEFYNPYDGALSLAGARIEAGDGSGPNRWTLRWTGHAGDSVAAGGRFVVGGAKVQPAPQSIVTLDLQNGPDAVRVVWPDGAVEVVGYGPQEFAEYACGAPAVDVPAGRSLARMPDDADLGANAMDFRAAAPSPGRANQPRRDLALVAGSLALAPEQPDPGASARLTGRIANAGAGSIASGEASLAAAAISEAGPIPLVTHAIGAALAAGDTIAFDESITLAAGKWRLRAAVVLAGDEAPDDDADSLLARAGPGPLELTEIQFHPARGEGEWVEVRNRSAAPVDLAAFTLSDRGTTRGVAAACALAPESLAVLAEDRAALIALFPGLDTARVRQVRPWPILNNSDDSSGVADLVVLREEDGTPCQRVAYSAAGVPGGTPLEWRDGGWWPSVASTGTPLAPPVAATPLSRRFACSPRRLRADGTARLAWDLPCPRSRVSLELYDLAGRLVARPVPEFDAPPRGERSWRAAEIPPGVYVALARARPPSGDPIVESSAIRIEGRAP